MKNQLPGPQPFLTRLCITLLRIVTLLRFAPRSRGDTIHVASAAGQYSQQEDYGFMLAICRRMVLSPDFVLALELLFWHHPVSHNYSWLVFMDILPVPYLLPLPLGGSVEHTRSESAGRIGVTSPFGPAARLRRFAAAADLSFSSFPLGGLSLDEVFSSESESGFWFKACKPTLVCYLCNTLQHLPILHQDTCCPSFASRLVCPFIIGNAECCKAMCGIDTPIVPPGPQH